MTDTHTKNARWMQAGMKMYLFPGYKKFREKTVQLAGISPNDVVLDFGCGVGLLEDFILPKLSENGKVVGVDIGKELIEVANDRFRTSNKCEYRVIDTSGILPFESQSFDIIVSSLVLHLLNDTQRSTVLKEFHRLLKPNGHLSLAEIGKPSSLFGYWTKFMTQNFWTRIWPYEANSVSSFEGRLPQLIRTEGFNDVRIVARMRGYIDFILCVK
jgi:ubiquinone/menaquinone biosynthesis C-methylase UbiE